VKPDEVFVLILVVLCVVLVVYGRQHSKKSGPR